jgi:DNA-binding GntR family transcriptional regulator
MTERNLNNRVYQQIKQMMINYEIIPGQRLIFSDLAEKLGVSRTPVNNALSLLSKEGFLDFTPNQGYTVHQITREEADSLYELRLILELGAIDKVVANLTPEQLKLLEKKEQAFQEAVAQNVSRGRFMLDEDFHSFIVGMSGNIYLSDYFREIYERIFLRHRIGPLRGDRQQQVPAEHHEIFDAIRSRDANRAKEAITHHVIAGKEYIYSYIFD